MLLNIKDGDIIEFDNGEIWVALYYTHLNDPKVYQTYRKNVKDHTGYYLFKGLISKNVLCPQSYLEYGTQLKAGHFNNIRIVGNILNKDDFEKYSKL